MFQRPPIEDPGWPEVFATKFVRFIGEKSPDGPFPALSREAAKKIYTTFAQLFQIPEDAMRHRLAIAYVQNRHMVEAALNSGPANIQEADSHEFQGGQEPALLAHDHDRPGDSVPEGGRGDHGDRGGVLRPGEDGDGPGDRDPSEHPGSD